CQNRFTHRDDRLGRPRGQFRQAALRAGNRRRRFAVDWRGGAGKSNPIIWLGFGSVPVHGADTVSAADVPDLFAVAFGQRPGIGRRAAGTDRQESFAALAREAGGVQAGTAAAGGLYEGRSGSEAGDRAANPGNGRALPGVLDGLFG